MFLRQPCKSDWIEYDGHHWTGVVVRGQRASLDKRDESIIENEIINYRHLANLSE